MKSIGVTILLLAFVVSGCTSAIGVGGELNTDLWILVKCLGQFIEGGLGIVAKKSVHAGATTM